VAVALCAACASLPPPPAKPVTHAWPPPEATELGTLAAAAAPYPRLSGLRLLASGEDALATLAALADHAQRTLDLQYYLMHDDASTRALLRHVLGAAQRGVRVRVLLDDLNTAGADDIVTLTRAARREVVLISPYFVPGKRGVALARELRARGVQLRVLTNSLAATDAPIVHVGYARYRHDLLEAGAQLHELRNQLGTPRSRFGTFGSSLASLHAKALVIDRRLLLIGSMNMDPRSARLNTEIALVMRSPALADGRLRWVGQAPGAPTVEGSEPDASMGLQFLLMLLSPFAPDELL